MKRYVNAPNNFFKTQNGVVVAVLIAGQLAPAGVGSDYTLYK